MAHIKLHSFTFLFVTIIVVIALQCSKICSMKELSVWAYESLENLPMILGFVIAARLWDVNLLAGLAILCLGMAFGVLVTRLVEPKLHNTKTVYYSPGRLGAFNCAYVSPDIICQFNYWVVSLHSVVG